MSMHAIISSDVLLYLIQFLETLRDVHSLLQVNKRFASIITQHLNQHDYDSPTNLLNYFRRHHVECGSADEKGFPVCSVLSCYISTETFKPHGRRREYFIPLGALPVALTYRLDKLPTPSPQELAFVKEVVMKTERFNKMPEFSQPVDKWGVYLHHQAFFVTGHLHGEETRMWRSGEKRVNNYHQGVKHGNHELYWDYGDALIYCHPYKHAVMHGTKVQVERDSSFISTREIHTDFVEGRHHGKWIVWKNGNKSEERTWDNDRLHGNAIDYYPEGQIQRTAPWFEGYKEGIEEAFYADGVLQERTVWRYNQQQESSHWNFRGELVRRSWRNQKGVEVVEWGSASSSSCHLS